MQADALMEHLIRTALNGNTPAIAATLTDPQQKTHREAFENALVEAVAVPRPELVRLLLDHGVDPNGRDRFGNLPLEVVQRYRYPEQAEERAAVIRLLLERGADPTRELFEETHLRGLTPVHKAVDEGYDRYVEVFLDAGVDVRLSNACGWTLLHTAVAQRRYSTAKLLLLRGAAPNAATTKEFQFWSVYPPGTKPRDLATGPRMQALLDQALAGKLKPSKQAAACATPAQRPRPDEPRE